MLASHEQASQVLLAVLVGVRRTQQRDVSQGSVLGVDISGEYPGDRI